MTVPSALQDALATAEGAGHTAVLAGWNGRARAMLAVADSLKPGAAATVAALRDRGMDVVLLTGDNEATATTIAGQVGIERVLAGVRPDAKQAEVASLQDGGEIVAMVGDGVNDAPALVQADLGIAIGTGTDVAIESSDLTLLRGDVATVVTAIDLSIATRRTIMQNLGWAFGYNVLAIPVAALGFLSPTIAGAAMAFSSVSVVAQLPAAAALRPMSDTRTDEHADAPDRRGHDGEQVTDGHDGTGADDDGHGPRRSPRAGSRRRPRHRSR